MILGIGLDLVTLSRISRNLERYGYAFLGKVLTEAERVHLPQARQEAYVAGRFAAKEAAVKALGTGFSEGIGLHDVETLPLPSGRPELRLHGKAARRAFDLGVRNMHVSLSHEQEMAAAVVILED